MVLKGRRKILSGFTEKDLVENELNIISLINNTISIHRANRSEIDYLMEYHKGVQPILHKTKLVRPEINNITVVNHAYRITRTITGYFLGTPIQYIQAGAKGKDEIDKLNRILSYEDKYHVDTEIGEKQSICGTAYRLFFTDGIFGDEVPFENKSLDPSQTYVVYENDIAEKPLAGITYYTIINESGKPDGYRFNIYTNHGLYIVDTKGESAIFGDVVEFTPYNVGGVPIIEYPNNDSRMGDWEFALSVMNAINSLYSNRLDDVAQVIQSLLVFTNADIDEEVYPKMRELGVVMLKNKTGDRSAVDIIKSELDQTGMNMLARELEGLLDTLVGVPSREKRGGGGADTGQAVELRDGWADLELVARMKEGSFKRSEKMALKIILTILSNKMGMKLNLMDVDIKFSRNKNHNLLVKTQSYTTLVATRTISPADCLAIVDLVTDTSEYIQRGEEYWSAKQELDDAHELKMSQIKVKIDDNSTLEKDET